MDSAKPKPKKRAWGKQRCRDKPVSIDQMDIETLTDVEALRTRPSSSCAVDLGHPELMTNETLMSHLTRMKVPNSKGKSRKELLCLYLQHVCPKPQRTRFWREKTDADRFWREKSDANAGYLARCDTGLDFPRKR